MNISVEYAGFIPYSTADGPGIRSVFFFHGCSRNCPGCHNADINTHGNGINIGLDEAVMIIDSGCRNHRITISGGEPLEQPDALRALVQALKARNYNICLYTGNTIDNVPKDILEQLDYIKTGSFVISLRDGTNPYAGSSNQHMYSIVNGSLGELIA